MAVTWNLRTLALIFEEMSRSLILVWRNLCFPFCERPMARTAWPAARDRTRTLFWEIVCLKQPFPRLRTHHECLTKISMGGLRPPLPRFKKLSPVVQEIMTTSWKESPKERASMKDIRAMLCAELRAMKREDDTEFRSLMLAEKSRRSIHQSMLRKQQQQQQSWGLLLLVRTYTKAGLLY